MLISKTAIIKWNSKICKHYIDLGYSYTKIGDELIVNVNDLTNHSYATVDVKCDYCGKIYQTKWFNYKSSRSNLEKDSCSNMECYEKKAKEAIKEKYGVEHIRELDFVNEKIKQTNLIKYGCENPFGNKEVQKKIQNYFLEHYGVKSSMQVNEIKEKGRKTCMEKYGVTNYGKIYSETHFGELSPCWKGGKAYERDERKLPEYRQWRKSVFERDLYTCQKCGIKNVKGLNKSIRLNAHHIFDWKHNVEKRFEIDNGITLCEQCHNRFHSIYGKTGNDKDQMDDYLKRDEKIC